TGIDELFAFAAAAGVKVIYSLRLLNPSAKPVGDLTQIHTRVTGYIWRHYQDNVASFAIGNEPDWHAFHAYDKRPLDPATYDATTLAPVVAAGLRYRLTESNDYLFGVPGASDAFASALWALDHLHWWAAHAAAGVNFHNKQWLRTDTIVPDPDAVGEVYTVTPK